MSKITSLDELSKLKEKLLTQRNQNHSVVVAVSMGTCGIAAGALDVLCILNDEINSHHLKNIIVVQTGCIGLCGHEPILEVIMGDAPRITYGKVTPDVVKRIVQEHILNGNAVEEFVIDATPFPTI